MLNRPTLAPTPATAPVEDPRLVLDIDATEREALLASLEIAVALAGGDVTGARFLATSAYSGPILRARLDTLADRVFRLGVPRSAVAPVDHALAAEAGQRN